MRRARAALLLVSALAARTAAPADGEVADVWKQEPPLAEVRANILAQQIGAGTVADFALPDSFVRRVADHIYREAFQRQFRGVLGPAVPAPVTAPPAANQGSSASLSASSASSAARHSMPAWTALPEAPPPLRGFRPEFGAGAAGWAFRPDAAASPALVRATELVAKRLAGDGLLATATRAIAILDDPAGTADSEKRLGLLAAAGIPTDLLAAFDTGREATPSSGDLHDDERRAAERVVVALQGLTRSGIPANALAAKLRDWPFRFPVRQTAFTCAPESGTLALQSLRLQCTRGDNWTGPGGGDSVDLALRLMTAAPGCTGQLTIESRFADVLTSSEAWRHAQLAERLTLQTQSLPVAQWAQDNGKAGWIEQDGRRQIATIVPRYASRSEERSVFVPDEHLAVVRSAELWPVVQSSLLFQGGNILMVALPQGRGCVLLVGEAEIHRNIALGLSRAQVEAAFAAEFGATQVVVLPAASFHIDLEVMCRTTEREVLAFVNDCDAGATLMVRSGLPACVSAGVLTAADAAAARAALDAAQAPRALERVLPAIQARQVAPGTFPADLAQHFSAGSNDRGPPNLRRFLIALDHLLSRSGSAEQLQADTYTTSYIRALQRTATDRAALRTELEALGWRVVPISSFEEPGTAVNTINGIHDRQRYFMPIHGGLYADLDRAAEAAFRRELGPDIRIVPVPTSETQTRSGALHCAVSAYYRAE